MAQTPQIGSLTVARGNLRRGPYGPRAVLCTKLEREARGAFRMSGYESVSVFKLF